MNKWCQKEIAEMIEAVAGCKRPEDVCGLYDVILTPREINDMARRYKVIEMLEEGHSYAEIREAVGVGSDTIGRISSKIGFGFRRVHSTVIKKGSTNQWISPLQRQRGTYYKGMPSLGTMIRNMKRK